MAKPSTRNYASTRCHQPAPTNSCRALLGDDAGLAPLTQLLIARTEGNPFFLEESVRTLVETGAWSASGGPIIWANPPTIRVPATVQAVLAARIDRLPSDEKRLLQTASVIGTEVPFALLQALAELSDATLHGGLAHLQTTEFLYETRLFPERAYTFKHALHRTRSPMASLLQERRRALHGRIVEAIEALAGDQVVEQVERLAHHALRVKCGRRPSPTVGRRGKGPGAVGLPRGHRPFEQTLHALAHLPEQREMHEQAIDLRIALRMRSSPLATPRVASVSWGGRCLAVLREAEALAVALDDPRRLGRICVLLTQHFFYRGMHDQVIATSQRAVACGAASGDNVLQALANQFLGSSYQAQGDYRRASVCLGQTVAALGGAQRHDLLGQTVPARRALPCLAGHVPCRARDVPRGESHGRRRAADGRGGGAP